MAGFLWFMLIAQGIIFGCFSSYVAKEKGRDNFSWFLNGFLFSLVALIAICGVPVLKPTSEKKPEEELDLTFDW